jgi:hypothetical protein
MACGKSCNCTTYRDHLLSVGFSANAMPTRKKRVIEANKTEKGWAKDHKAYKTMRQQGLRPARLTGAAKLQDTARDRLELESGKRFNDLKFSNELYNQIRDPNHQAEIKDYIQTWKEAKNGIKPSNK